MNIEKPENDKSPASQQGRRAFILLKQTFYRKERETLNDNPETTLQKIKTERDTWKEIALAYAKRDLHNEMEDEKARREGR